MTTAIWEMVLPPRNEMTIRVTMRNNGAAMKPTMNTSLRMASVSRKSSCSSLAVSR